jgi:6-pyruvoyltetrahydropterin/6-carboxytetrahydropterin synthase
MFAGEQALAASRTKRSSNANRARMSMSSWKILIERGNLEFSAAHFITFEGECEPLHGHNYGVRVEAEGELTADSYVVDFVVMKDIVRTLIKRWDHRFLLPLGNPHLRISEQEEAWEVEFVGGEAAAFLREHGRIHYQMPKWSVVPLPVDNATAERLAERLALDIVAELRARSVGEALTSLAVGVEETAMQTAFYTLDPRSLGKADSALGG